MRLHEIMGLEQSRRWGVCSLNEFRRFLGLKGEFFVPKWLWTVPNVYCAAFETFLEWNSNPEIADAAEKLYGDIEHLELYVGLQAEEAKPLVEGAGLCPGKSYTTRLYLAISDSNFRIHCQSRHLE